MSRPTLENPGNAPRSLCATWCAVCWSTGALTRAGNVVAPNVIAGTGETADDIASFFKLPVIIVRAGVDGDVGRGPLRSPLLSPSAVGKGPLWSPLLSPTGMGRRPLWWPRRGGARVVVYL